MSNKFSYDSVIYPSYVFQHLRPDRFAAIAAVHGINAIPIDDCRILELGCGDGANLISIAHTMPNSNCVGIDLAVEPIKQAGRITSELGLANARFFQQDLMEFDPAKYGEFDFIIAHGVYSWVPENVREKILWIYEKCLTPKGIGYISFNAYPGWHLRGLVRDAMLFQSSLIDDPDTKVESAVNFLEFLSESAAEDSIYKNLLSAELEVSLERPVENIYHDELSYVNQPFYFTEFNSHIEKHGLKFIAESEPVASFDHRFPQFTRDALDKLWHDPIRREQYIDFIKCKRFRSPLVCRADNDPSYRGITDHIDHLFVAGETKPIEAGSVLDDDSSVKFSGSHGTEFDLNNPFAKTALAYIGSRWPERIRFIELFDQVKTRLPEMRDEAIETGKRLLKAYLIELMHSTAIELRAFNPVYLAFVSERPKVSDFARWQARSGYSSVNGNTGASMGIKDEGARHLLVSADGTRTVEELIEEMVKSMGNLDSAADRNYAREFVTNNLIAFANGGLLVA